MRVPWESCYTITSGCLLKGNHNYGNQLTAFYRLGEKWAKAMVLPERQETAQKDKRKNIARDESGVQQSKRIEFSQNLRRHDQYYFLSSGPISGLSIPEKRKSSAKFLNSGEQFLFGMLIG